jgi:coenzyme F420-reducing hydrogenase beta subunit
MGLTATVGLGLACLLQSLKVEKRNALRQKLLMRIMYVIYTTCTQTISVAQTNRKLSNLNPRLYPVGVQQVKTIPKDWNMRFQNGGSI